MRSYFGKLLVAAVLLTALSACNQAGAPKLKDNAVKLDMYVMSQCPYGVQVENAVKPALDQLAGYVDFKLEFIVTEEEPGKFKSLHGEPEVKGNLFQVCAIKHYPAKYMDFVMCQNENVKQITENWKPCAEKFQMDASKLQTCAEGDEGKGLLVASGKRAAEAKAQGSPTIKLNGEDYRGGRRSEDFVRAICGAMQGEKPQVCSNIPEPPVVNLTVLSDTRCELCERQSTQIGDQLKSFIPGLKVTKLDYATPEGKKLYDETQVKLLPAFLFDSSIDKDTEGKGRLGRWLQPKGSFQSLMVGAKFDPTAEICDNKVDDTGDGKIDCDDPTCQADLLCRTETPKRLDLFVMSQCPYGVRALNAMEEVLKNFKDSGIDFHVNFIATKTDDGFKALHGQPEVDENIRELCAIKHYPKNFKYMDYILCRNKDIRSAEWKTCAVNGIDAAVMDKCFSGDEGKKLLEENIKLAESLNLSASPSWLANNKYKFSGVAADAIKSSFCKYNQGLKGCENALSTEAKGGENAGSCGGN